MDKINAFWQSFVKFLKDYDTGKIMATVQTFEWKAALTNPLVWVISIPVLALMLWKRQIRLLLLIVSTCLFMILLQNTLPPPGESISLGSILKFIGGGVGLVAVNLYFLFIRES